MKKKKSLFTKEESEDESDDSPCEGDETLFMTEIKLPKKTKSSNVEKLSNLENCEIDLKGELLCAL